MSPFSIELECRFDVVPEAIAGADGTDMHPVADENDFFFKTQKAGTGRKLPLYASRSLPPLVAVCMVNTDLRSPFNPLGVLTRLP